MDKLGKRLAADGQPNVADRTLFIEVVRFYQHLLDVVTGRLFECGIRCTSRVKTTSTLVDKLRRERGIQLTRINDIAGARIVTNGGGAAQDHLRDVIVALFKDNGRKPVVINRRTDPRFGYRAIHVIVYLNQFPVEIQIRTQLQDAWAQIFERLADQWGRQMRYGELPDNPDAFVPMKMSAKRFATRRTILPLLDLLGADIAYLEARQAAENSLTGLEKTLKNEANALMVFGEAANEVDENARQSAIDAVEYKSIRLEAINLARSLIHDKRRLNRTCRHYFSRKRFNPSKYSLGVDLLSSEAGEAARKAREARLIRQKSTQSALTQISKIQEVESMK